MNQLFNSLKLPNARRLLLKLPFQEVARYIREALPEEMKSKVPSKVSEKLGPAVMGPAPPLPVLYDVSPAEKLSLGSLEGPGRSFKVLEGLGCSPYMWVGFRCTGCILPSFFHFFSWCPVTKHSFFFPLEASSVAPEVGHQLQVS